MKQSKLASFIEACANTAFGFIFSFAIQKILNFWYGVEMSDATAMWFVFWFTIASVLRSYIIRRIGNHYIWDELKGYRARKKLIQDASTNSSKSCPDCGTEGLVLLSSVDLKMCPDCNIGIEWDLTEGQSSTLTNRKG